LKFLNNKNDISLIAIIAGGKHLAAFVNNFGNHDLLKAMPFINPCK